jgi:hypothetical protein
MRYKSVDIHPSARREDPLQGVLPPPFLPEELLCGPLYTKPILIELDWLRSETFEPFHLIADARKMQSASGQRESATNRLGEHGGLGFGPMRQKCKSFSASRLTVGGVSISVA